MEQVFRFAIMGVRMRSVQKSFVVAAVTVAVATRCRIRLIIIVIAIARVVKMRETARRELQSGGCGRRILPVGQKIEV